VKYVKHDEKEPEDNGSQKRDGHEDDDEIEIIEPTEEIIEVENYTTKSDLEADVEAAITGHRIDRDTIAQMKARERLEPPKRIEPLKILSVNSIDGEMPIKPKGVRGRKKRVPIEMPSTSEDNSSDSEFNPSSFVETTEEILGGTDDINGSDLIKIEPDSSPNKRKISDHPYDTDDDEFDPEPESDDEEWSYSRQKKSAKKRTRRSVRTRK
jgi:hypothetical protein